MLSLEFTQSAHTSSLPRVPVTAPAGELGIFEMRNTGLEAVTNAAALFVPSATAGHQQGSTDSSNRLVGTAVAVIQDGARPLPIEVQALVAPRLRIVVQEPAQLVDDGYSDIYSDVTNGASDSEADASDVAFGEGDDSYEDESSFGSDITGAGLMRGADKFVAAEAGVSPREVLPMVRSIVGLPDRARMGQLLELLTRYTPIKVGGRVYGLTHRSKSCAEESAAGAAGLGGLEVQGGCCGAENVESA
jgi:hypothetical protein